MKPFKSVKNCQKCGRENNYQPMQIQYRTAQNLGLWGAVEFMPMGMGWFKGPKLGDVPKQKQTIIFEESLQIKCSCCGYTWFERCADFKESPQEIQTDKPITLP